MYNNSTWKSPGDTGEDQMDRCYVSKLARVSHAGSWRATSRLDNQATQSSLHVWNMATDRPAKTDINSHQAGPDIKQVSVMFTVRCREAGEHIWRLGYRQNSSSQLHPHSASASCLLSTYSVSPSISRCSSS